MYKLVLMRHGESEWNLENRFTGWQDVDLTDLGCSQAKKAAKLLKINDLSFDLVYTSSLKRAIRTAWIVLDNMNIMYTPMNINWRLNERHYGVLQGLNKSETTAKYGKEQVLNWRRSYTCAPEALSFNDLRHPRFDHRYKKINPEQLPTTECLKDTFHRVLPFWENSIFSSIKSGRRVLIVAHGNSLRSLIKYLDNLSENDILDLNIPTGQPLVYELDSFLKPIRKYYLAKSEEIAAEISAVANQTKID